MVKIRLTRTGRKNHATFRIAVTEARTKRDTKSIELVGYYLPHEKKIEVNAERVNHWLSVGAQPSPTVKRLLIKAGVLKAEKKAEAKFSNKPGKKATERTARKAEKVEALKQAAEEAKKAAEAPVEVEAPAEEASEATTEEAAVEATEEAVADETPAEAEAPAEEAAAESTEVTETTEASE
jgi:small subunit ribosomal protein S16